MRKKIFLSLLLILSTILLFLCKAYEGIEGETDEWISDENISIRTIAIYRGSPEKFSHLQIIMKNNQVDPISINWVRYEYFGKKVIHDVGWAPVYESNVNVEKGYEVFGLTGTETQKVNEQRIKEYESKLEFFPYTLESEETCNAFLSPLGGGNKYSKVKISIILNNKDKLGPYLIKITNPKGK